MPRKRAKRPRGMGSAPYFRGGTWSIRWRENGRRYFKSGYPDQGTATDVLNKILLAVAREEGGLPPDRSSVPPLAELSKDWLKRRAVTHRSHREDASRWNVHLGPFFGKQRPDEVTPADIRRFAEKKVGAGLSSATIGLCVRLLSSLYTDLVERGLARQNVAKGLPRSLRRLLRSTHDPKTTPFLERQDDIRRVFLALPQPFATIFALGALAGLRPGEVLAIEWNDIDLPARRLRIQRQVRHGRVGPPKSGKARLVPISDLLAKVLAEWKLATGGQGQLFRPENPLRGGRKGSPPRYLNLHTVHEKLREALEACGLSKALTLYQCTRHSYAAHFVMAGGSLRQLQEILGHSTVVVTERYGHLRLELVRVSDLPAMDIDLSRPGGAVIDLSARREDKAVGYVSGTTEVDESTRNSVSTHRT